ncbi:MAG: CAP domain-containing protein [Myxococcota bacterium]
MTWRRVVAAFLGALLLTACGEDLLRRTYTLHTGTPRPDPADLPPFCDDVLVWDDAWIAFEAEVLRLTNEQRAAGAMCGALGYGRAPPLTEEPALTCAARKHAADMAARDFMAHDNPDGETPWDRIDSAGYRYNQAAENVAGGYGTPADVVAGWISSQGHCQNVMSFQLSKIGVGFSADDTPVLYSTYWVQVFADP